ncbi:hypothetical protein ACFGOO_12040 [Treponema vincentii]|uniref:hypothetical protein n=1 Tax=Treponema vincentii TaxID=69710 RepID=UPI0035F59784
MKQKIRRKHPHRVKFLQMKKEYRMCNQSIKDLSESIDKLTRAIKKANDCPVLKCPKWLCWCTVICLVIQIIIAIVFIICVGCNLCNTGAIAISIKCLILGGISLGILILNYLSLIRIQTISRYIILTAGYEKAIQDINRGSDTAEAKMKYTAAVYQHYCQSLTKK